MKRTIVALVVLALAAQAAYAEPLNVKPGMWETVTTIEKKGSKHPANLDGLTAEQRAKVEIELAKRAKKETHTVRSCLTAAKIASGEAFTGNAHRGACTHTFQKQTASEVGARIECKGANNMTGTVSMRAADTEHMTGVVDMTFGAPDRVQLLTHSEITARWLGANCAAPAGVASAPHS